MEGANPIRRARATAGKPDRPRRPLAAGQALGLGAAVSLAALALHLCGVFAAADAAAFELMSRLRGTGRPGPTVVVCAIERAGRAGPGPWPWPRADLALLVERIAEGGARVIVLDLDLASTTPPGEGADRAWEDEALAAAIAAAHNVVLAVPARLAGTAAARQDGRTPSPKASAVLENESGPGPGFSVPELAALEPSLDLFRAAAIAEGFAAAVEGEARRRPLLASDGVGVWPSLGLAAAAAWEGRPARLSAPGANKSRREQRPRLRLSGEPVPIDGQGRLTLDLRRPPALAPAAEVLAGRAGGDLLNDRLVFVGLTEEAMGASTSFTSTRSPLGLEARAAANLLARTGIRAGGAVAAVGWLATLAWGSLAAAFAWLSRSRGRAALATAGLVLLWPVAAFGALTAGSCQLPVAAPMLAAAGAALGVFGIAGSQRKRRRQEIAAVLTGTVPEAAVEALAADSTASLAAERRRATVLAVEISGLSELADRLAPEAFEAELQRALAPLSAVVLGAGGAVESAGADALKAVFGAPLAVADPAVRAVRAAAALRNETGKLKAAIAAAREVPLANVQPALEVGIASGEMTVGVLAADGRPRYTAAGAAASLGARLARLGRVYGAQVLLDELTAGLAGDHFLLRELDRVRLRGQAAPIAVFELVAVNPASPNDRQRVVRYEAGLAAFRNREFVRAERLLASIVEDLGEDPPARLLAERCRRLRAAPPPEGWDGTAVYPHF